VRFTQKHCVQHRKAAIDWLECFWRPFLFLFALTEFCKIRDKFLNAKSVVSAVRGRRFFLPP
jgi:hypothetical protein